MTKQKSTGGGPNSLLSPAAGPATPTPLSEDVIQPAELSLPSQVPPGHGRISCAEALDMIGDYLSHELTTLRKDAFVKHIRTCESCHRKLLTIEIQLHLAAVE